MDTTSHTAKVWTSTMGYPEGYFEDYWAEVEFIKNYPNDNLDTWSIKAGTKGEYQITFSCTENREELVYPLGYHMDHYVTKEYYKICAKL